MFTVEIHYFRTALVLNYLKEINNYANGTINMNNALGSKTPTDGCQPSQFFLLVG